MNSNYNNINRPSVAKIRHDIDLLNHIQSIHTSSEIEYVNDKYSYPSACPLPETCLNGFLGLGMSKVETMN